MAVSGDVLVATADFRLARLSIAVALVGSYTAIDIAEQIEAANPHKHDPCFVTLERKKLLQNLKMRALSAFSVLFPNIGYNLQVLELDRSTEGVSEFALAKVMEEGYQPKLACAFHLAGSAFTTFVSQAGCATELAPVVVL